jgi:PAS domain S-box-containing protein
MNNFEFFCENIDYLRFILGISYLFLGLIGIGVLINFKKTLRPYFVLFAFLISLYYLIGIFIPFFGANLFFTPIRLTFLLASNIFLIESGRRIMRISGINWLGLWIYIPLIILLTWGISPDMVVNEAMIIYVCSIPGFFLLFFGIFRLSFKYKGFIKRLILLYSFIVLFFGVCSVFEAPKTSLVFSSFLNEQFFISTFQFPVELLLIIVLNLILLLNFHIYMYATQQFLNVGILKYRAYGLYFFYALFLITVASGWAFTNRIAKKETTEMEREFLTNSRLVANAINIEHIKNLKGNETDIKNDDYLRIKQQIFMIRKANEEFRFIYLNAIRNDTVILLVDSEDTSSTDYSPPGQKLIEATTTMKNVFYSRLESVDGPYADRWGTWVSAYIPIVDKSNGKILCVVGIDRSAKEWLLSMQKGRVLPITIVAILMILLLIFISFYQQNKLQEIRLSTSEKRYRTLFENIRDAAFLVNLDKMEIVETNRQAEFLLKESREKIIGLPFADLFIEKESINNIQIGFQDGYVNSNTAENKIIDTKGNSIYVEANSGYLFINGEKHLIAILRDITDRKQAEIELQRSKDRAELLFRMVPSAIFTVDNDKRITSWNENAASITGYTAEEAIGNHCNLFADNPCSGECGLFSNELKPIMHRECTIKTKGGQIRDIIKNVDFLKDLNGNIFGGIESFEDITEIKNTELELIKAKKAAEAASFAKSEFLANMSHEIRTPINGVVGLTDLLLNSNISKLQAEYLENIKYSAFSLLEIINAILDFSKIEAGKLRLENDTIDIISLVENVVKMFSGRIDPGEIELLCFIENKMPRYLVGDEVKLRQILINFLSNAVKFIEKGEIFVSLTLKTNNQVSLSVKDSGIGIKPEKLDTIFEKFIQADSGSTRLYGGTGLGLSISKSLAELMNGRIEVASELGTGSEFTLLFPYESAGITEVSDGITLTIKKALLVDDNTTNLKILQHMLQRFMIESVTVDNILAALECVLEDKEIDIVILDFQMPATDALSFAEQIRTSPLEKQPLIILMLTNINTESIFERAFHLNITQFLLKPITYSQIFDTLQSVSGSTKPEIKILNNDNKLKFQPKDKSILIAEDHRINLMVIQNRLENMGFIVQVALNGAEAIKKFSNEKFDMIIMDVHMPEVDGYEATRKIREMEQGRSHIPIIALSADVLVHTIEKCISCGMDDYISKPFKSVELIEILNKYLT